MPILSQNLGNEKTEHADTRKLIIKSLEILHPPGSVVELRIPKAGRNGTISGYFDNFELLADAALQYSGAAPGIYFSLNPVNKALLARASNKIKARATATTSDRDIITRRWFPLDFDPVRPAEISSSEEEQEQAHQKARQVTNYLIKNLGWPEPLEMDSGNGAHRLWRIDEPNDDATRDLIKKCLEVLDAFHSDKQVCIDQTVYNASRIWKLPRTMARKGEDLEDRPHRQAKILKAPEPLEVVSREQLEALAALLPEPKQPRGYTGVKFDIETWMAEQGLKVYRQKTWQGGVLYELETCPFDPEHNRTARVVQMSNGALSYGCFHNSCSGKDWQALRDNLEPGWRDKRQENRQQDSPQATRQEAAPVIWPDPEPIKTTLLPVEELPPEIIPGPLRGWVVDVAYRMQCPLDFIAAAVMVIVGALIGTSCGIKPKRKDDWLVIPNLWGGVIGKPGTLKSPALLDAMKPLSQMEAKAKEQYDENLTAFEAEKEVSKAQKEAVKAEMIAAAKGKGNCSLDELKGKYTALEPPVEPPWRRYKTNDSTIEKMAELLRKNPRGMLLFRDELVGLLTSWDKEGRESDRAFYLEAWNGYGGTTSDRIGRGTVHVENACISILGGIQPAKLLAYLYQATSELDNDGLIQRMQLLVYPDEPADWDLIDEYPDAEAKQRAVKVFKKLAEVDPVSYGAETNDNDKTACLHFSEEAQELFNEWLRELQKKLQADEAPVILEHLNKYRSLMPSLALIDHLINVVDSTASGPVPLESAERAAAWCDYLESHARRIYGLVGDIGQRAAVELAKKLRAKKLQDGFTVRDVYRNGWHLLTTKEVVKAACDELAEAGWLQAIISRDSKKRTVYLINPQLFC